MTNNGWEVNDPTADLPNPAEEEYHGSAYIKTNCGKIDFSFMPNATKNGSELRGVTFYSDYLTDTNVSVAGVSMDTTIEEAKQNLPIVVDNSSGYGGGPKEVIPECETFLLDDHVEILIHEGTKFDSGDWKQVPYMSVEKTFYHMRNK